MEFEPKRNKLFRDRNGPGTTADTWYVVNLPLKTWGEISHYSISDFLGCLQVERIKGEKLREAPSSL